MRTAWTWESGTPKERGEMVRSTLPHVRHDMEKLCELFCLTGTGAREIVAGSDWKPEHDTNAA